MERPDFPADEAYPVPQDTTVPLDLPEAPASKVPRVTADMREYPADKAVRVAEETQEHLDYLV